MRLCWTGRSPRDQALPLLCPLCPTIWTPWSWRMRERMTLPTSASTGHAKQSIRNFATQAEPHVPCHSPTCRKLNGFRAPPTPSFNAHDDQSTPVTRQELPVFLLLDTPGGHQHCTVGVCGVRCQRQIARRGGGANLTPTPRRFSRHLQRLPRSCPEASR